MELPFDKLPKFLTVAGIALASGGVNAPPVGVPYPVG
jgi:hypothetical protein